MDIRPTVQLHNCKYFLKKIHFRIKITDTIEYSSHTEEKADPVAVMDLPLEPPLDEAIKKKPILMVKVENVLHEPFKLTDEVKVQNRV